MRLALAAVAFVVAVGPAGAAEHAEIVSAYLSTNNAAHIPQALFTVRNNASHPLGVIVSCAALDGNELLDVVPAPVGILKAGEVAYGAPAFNNAIPSGGRVSCRVETEFTPAPG